MKPYETGICVKCHEKIESPDYLCRWDHRPCIDSGTAHLCSEEVASMMFGELEKIRDLSVEEWARKTADRAINEALKRERYEN